MTAAADESDEDACHDSGPFCPHFCTPGDCEECAEPCATCGHAWIDHEDSGQGACSEDGCACLAFVSAGP
jgi:hypothetical protein